MIILNMNRAACCCCVFLLVGLLTLSSAIGQMGDDQSSISSPTAPPVTGQLLVDTIPAPSLAGNLFEDPTRQPLVIYLPPSYGTSQIRYPVVYFLPGFGDAISLYLDGTYQGFRLKNAMDSLIHAGAIKEMIIVIVNGRNRFGGSFYTNSPATGNWETYIAAGLVTFIDSHYRTILSPGARAITGHSMGGYGALSLGMRHPDIFGCVYAMSPGLFDPEGLSKSLMFAERQSVRDYLSIESSLKGLGRLEAATRCSIVFDSLLTASRWDLAFTFAYGAAFAARPSANAPHIEYPFTLLGDSLVQDSIAWEHWERGFGDLQAKIAKYQGLSEKLRALSIEYGEQDEAGWIPSGCQYFSQLLTEKRIQHQLIPFAGGHQDSLGIRLTRFMLPFCSENLLVQKSKSSQPSSNTKTTPKSSKTKRKK